MHLSWMIIRVRLALFTGKRHYIIAVYCQISVHDLYGIILFIGMYEKGSLFINTIDER